MTNCPEAIVDFEGRVPNVWVRLNEYGGYDVVREGKATGYGHTDKVKAVEMARRYCAGNNCTFVEHPLYRVNLPLPQFEAYVDQLAKQGLIDGNIAERLTAFHRQEIADPRGPVREALRPVLDEMFDISKVEKTDEYICLIVRGYAERIDDILEGGDK